MSLAVRRAARADMERLAVVHVRCWQETYHGMLSEGLLASQTPAADVIPNWENLREIRLVRPGQVLPA